MYERPQSVADEILTKEAMTIFQDIKTKKMQNVHELIAICIARSQEQYDQMPQCRISI